MPEYTVVWKKEYKVDEPDELAAVDEAEERLNADMAQQFFSAGEFFEVRAQKEPVKEICLTEQGIREFLHEYFVAQYTVGGKSVPPAPTEQRIKDFMDFLESDITEWIKENWSCFMDKGGDA